MAAHGARRRHGRHADIGQQHRQQQQIGEDQHRDTDTGGHCQVADHRNVDGHQHRKADGVGQQRGQAGQEQAAEGVARRHQPVRAAAHVLHDAVHLLRAMRHADGKYQERHQDRERIEREAQSGHQPQLPQHRHQRARHHQRGRAQAAGVCVDHQRGNRRGGAEVHQHLLHAGQQFGDQLRKADHVDLHRPGGRLVRLHRLLDGMCQFAVVDGRAGRRVLVQQRHEDHGGLVVIAHQAADDAGARDVDLQLFDAARRAVISVRHHRPALEALLRHFGPAHRGGPHRFHPGAVHPGREEQRIIDLFQRFQVARLEDVALRVLHHHAQRVAQATQGRLVLQIVLDIRLPLRQHLLKAGVQVQTGGRQPAQHHGRYCAQQHHRHAVVEYQPLQPVA